MARSTETIQATMDVEQATQTDLTTLNSTSQTAIYTLWKFITSSIINYFEQLWDFYKADLETTISRAAVGSEAWWKQQMLIFQYDAVTPQVLTIGTDFSINYATVDATKRVVTRCSVKTAPNKTVLIKLAMSEPPVALSAPILSSATGYVGYKSFAGVKYTVTSLDSDKMYLKANIYYNGQYAATISATVIAAIKDYLAHITFDGNVKLTSLVDYIQQVPGVTDIVLVDVAIRADTTAFASKTYLVAASTTIIPIYQTLAGYIEEETTSGQDFATTLTFIAQ